MTTEEDFQQALDAHPDDHHTRLVFADWLDERDDPRAAGYRALGVLRRRAMRYEATTHAWCSPARFGSERGDTLPQDWFDTVLGTSGDVLLRTAPTRREAEDAAAKAFALLPAERQTELLSGVPT